MTFPCQSGSLSSVKVTNESAFLLCFRDGGKCIGWGTRPTPSEHLIQVAEVLAVWLQALTRSVRYVACSGFIFPLGSAKIPCRGVEV